MGLTLEELQKQGAKPLSPPKSGGLTLEELQKQGAKQISPSKSDVSPEKEKQEGLLNKYIFDPIENNWTAPFRSSIGHAQETMANPGKEDSFVGLLGKSISSMPGNFMDTIRSGSQKDAPSWEDIYKNTNLPQTMEGKAIPFGKDGRPLDFSSEEGRQAYKNTPSNPMEVSKAYDTGMGYVTDPINLLTSTKAVGGLLNKGVQKTFQGAAELAKPAANYVSKLAEKYADTYAIKSAGAMLKDFRNIFNRGTQKEIAETMFNHEMIHPGATYETISEKSGEALKSTGEKIGQIYDQIGPALSQSLDHELPQVAERIITKIESGAPMIGKKEYLESMSGLVEDIVKNKEKLKDPRYLNDIIGEIDAKINWAKQTSQSSKYRDGLMDLRSELRKITVDMAEKAGDIIGNPTLKKELLDANREYHNLKTINGMSTDRVAREAAKNYMGLIPTLSVGSGAIAGAATGHTTLEKVENGLLGAGAGLLGSKTAKYGLPIAAKGARALGSSAGKLSDALSIIGPNGAEFLGSTPGRIALGSAASVPKYKAKSEKKAAKK